MNLLLARSQQKTLWGGYRFELVASFDLTNHEKDLVRKYNVDATVMSEGDPVRDLKRAAWWAAPIALIIMAIDYVVPFVSWIGLRPNGVAPTILLGLISFTALTWLIYH